MTRQLPPRDVDAILHHLDALARDLDETAARLRRAPPPPSHVGRPRSDPPERFLHTRDGRTLRYSDGLSPPSSASAGWD